MASSATPKLIPPKGDANGKTYILCNPSGARDQRWAFRDGGWFIAGRIRQSPTDKGTTPAKMAKLGWQFQVTQAPGITTAEAKIARAVRKAAEALNRASREAREAGVSVGFALSIHGASGGKPTSYEIVDLRIARPDDWENDTPGRDL